jgi:prepilin-type N-terminal cleavage/methylation domain-containing protein
METCVAASSERDVVTRRPARRVPRDAGFSLMEIMVALSVFAVLAVACATMAIDSLGVAGDNRERVRAANLASAEIERTRAVFRAARGSVPETTVVSPTVVDGNSYSVARTTTWVDAEGDPATDAGVSYTAATGTALLVEVRVSWPDLGTRPPVINTTVLS